jgi:anti-sigma28 factor (negative regulator of flagellin synthesis)
MRIDDLNRTPVTQGTEKSGQTAQQRAPEKDAVGGSDQPDQAEVSHLAQSLAASDPGRIEQLSLQVQSGSYDVSAQALANALIDAHLKE